MTDLIRTGNGSKNRRTEIAGSITSTAKSPRRLSAATKQSQPLKVAIVAPPWFEIPPPSYGGIEVMCATLIDGLVERGHEVTLIGVGENGTRANFRRTFKEPQFKNVSMALPEAHHIAEVQKILNEEQFDIIHDHTTTGPLCAPMRNAPTVLTAHRPIEETGDYYATLDNSVSLVSISYSQRAPRPDLNWAGTVHNGISIDQFTFNPKPRDYALWLARFNPEKGPDIAIKMCREAGIPLVLAGKLNEESEKEYFNNVIKPMLGDDVKVVINASRSEVVELARNARCLIHSVRWAEPFGMVMIEAMSCGTPVLGLRRGAVPEVVADGLTGWVRDDPAELTKMLTQIDQIDRNACRQWVEEQFSAQAVAERYERVYHRVLSQGRSMPTPRPSRSGSVAHGKWKAAIA